MGCAGEARVIGSKCHFDQCSGILPSHQGRVSELLRCLFHRKADRGRIVLGSHYKIHHGEDTFIICFIMMEKGTAGHSQLRRPLLLQFKIHVPNILAGQLWLVRNDDIAFGSLQSTDQTSPVRR